MIKEKRFETQVNNLDEFLSGINLVVILVAHEEIRKNEGLLKDKTVYDTRNVVAVGEKVYKL